MLVKQVNIEMGRTYNKATILKVDDLFAYVKLEVVTGQDDEENDIIEHTEPMNHFPIDDSALALDLGEIEYVQNKIPHIGWDIPMIKLWLDDQGVSYQSNALESELLDLVNTIEDATEY